MRERKLPEPGPVDPAKALVSLVEGRPLLDCADPSDHLRMGSIENR